MRKNEYDFYMRVSASNVLLKLRPLFLTGIHLCLKELSSIPRERPLTCRRSNDPTLVLILLVAEDFRYSQLKCCQHHLANSMTPGVPISYEDFHPLGRASAHLSAS